MSQNVAQELEKRASSLYDKLSTNNHVAGCVMGFLGKLVVESFNQGKPIEGIKCGEVFESMGTFTFKVEFQTLSIPSYGLWQFGGDLLSYVNGKSRNMARALEKNPGLIKTFSELVDVIDRFCRRKNVPFKDFKVKKSFFTKENTCVIVSGEETLDQWGR